MKFLISVFKALTVFLEVLAGKRCPLCRKDRVSEVRWRSTGRGIRKFRQCLICDKPFDVPP